MRYQWQGDKAVSGLAVFAVVPLLAAGLATAMEPLDDDAMASVSGRDGIAVEFAGDQLNADAIAWRTDREDAARDSNFAFQDITFGGVDPLGQTGGGYSIQQTLDVGGDGAGSAAVAYSLNMSDVRLAVDAMRLNRDPLDFAAATPDPRSFGQFAIDASSATINFVNVDGLLDASGSSGILDGSITDGRIFYRQLWHEHPYLLLNNLQAQWKMEGATIGVVDALTDPFAIGPGLIQSADRIDMFLRADWEYKFPVGLGENSFTVTGAEVPVFRFGWSGAVKDADLVWRGAGGWDNDDWANPSQGLTFSSRWNYITNAEATAAGDPESEFRWIFGESGGGVQIELGDWTPLGNNPYGHNFPLIGLDVLSGGDGPGGLCFGGPNSGPSSAGAGCTGANDQLLNLDAGHLAAFDRDTYSTAGAPSAAVRTDAPSLAMFIRDGNLLTTSNKVKLRQDGTEIQEFDWGLIFTLANVDANMYLYPGGNPSDDTLFGGGGDSLDNGFIIDLLLMTQSFDPADSTQQGLNWHQGSHFMLADTEFEGSGAGIGFLGVSLLMAANDARFWIKPQWDANDYYEGGLDILAPQARYNFRGIFGGGSLPNGDEIVQGAYLDINLEGLLNLRLSPSDPDATIVADGGENFLGYSMATRFGNLDDPEFNFGGGSLGSGSGTYFAVAEPGRQDVEVRFGDISGDVALTNGIMDLRGPGEEGPLSRPALVISQDILIGQTATARMNDAVVGHTLPGGPAGQPLVINDVSFSGDSLGKIAVPSGHWGSTLKFKPQL